MFYGYTPINVGAGNYGGYFGELFGRMGGHCYAQYCVNVVNWSKSWKWTKCDMGRIGAATCVFSSFFVFV